MEVHTQTMMVLNFSHPLTGEQLHQLEELTGRKVDRVVDVDAQVDVQRPLAPQVGAMTDRAGLTSEEWQTLPILVCAPSLNFSAVTLIAELHGRCGHFPPVVRLRPVAGSVPTRFEVAEVLDLQAVRDEARRKRS